MLLSKSPPTFRDYISPDKNFPRTISYLPLSIYVMIYSEVAFLFIFVVCLFNLGIRLSSVFSEGKIDRHTTGVDDFKKNIFFFHLVSLIDVCN